MPAGLEVSVGGSGHSLGQIRARVDGGQVWMGQNDWAGMGDMASGWVWVCEQV